MHTHTHDHEEQGTWRLFLALAVVFVVIVLQIIGSVMSGSLALLADAGHLAVDGLALSIAIVAIILGRRPPDTSKTYGYQRWEIIAAGINGLFLALMVGLIGWESIGRFFQLQEVNTGIMLPVAILGLVGNGLQLVLLHPSRSETHNIAMAFQHVLGDFLSSAVVILAAVFMRSTGWMFLDPLASLVVAAVIVKSGWPTFRETINILLEAAPREIKVPEVVTALEAIDGVKGVHDLHITVQSSRNFVASVHIVVEEQSLSQALVIVADVRTLLREQFRIGHATVELESKDTVGELHPHCEIHPKTTTP